MSIDGLIQPFKTFYANNTELTIAVAVVVVIAILINPKSIKKILVGVAIIAVIGYLVSSLIDVTHKGADRKNDAGARTDKTFRDKGQ